MGAKGNARAVVNPRRLFYWTWAVASVHLGCGAFSAPVADVTQQEQTEQDDTLAADFEREVLILVNQHRAAGADCGVAGRFESTHPLIMDAALQAAARDHSADMASRDFFDHINPDGADPGDRIADAGYSATAWGENIAWGQRTPTQVVETWMSSPGHCANIMRPTFSETGIGFDSQWYWTQVFAAP